MLPELIPDSLRPWCKDHGAFTMTVAPVGRMLDDLVKWTYNPSAEPLEFKEQGNRLMQRAALSIGGGVRWRRAARHTMS